MAQFLLCSRGAAAQLFVTKPRFSRPGPSLHFPNLCLGVSNKDTDRKPRLKAGF